MVCNLVLCKHLDMASATCFKLLLNGYELTPYGSSSSKCEIHMHNFVKNTVPGRNQMFHCVLQTPKVLYH